MNEKPVERLNYFNGQRLQAADFKLEQEYHMRVRRWLNRSLYTPGIASGLEVYAIAGAPKVKVLPGLAIDHLGREIILLEEQNVDVIDQGGNGNGNGNGVCKGPYLTIRYQEEVIAQQDACCAVGGDSKNKAAWGGPARILAEPVLEMNAELPHESSGKIALACLTLAKGCASVETTVDTGVRRYVGEAFAAKVRQYALEGVRDIDENNPGIITFHIEGRQPRSIALYLRGAQFPTLYYTELGKHKHASDIEGGIETSTDGAIADHRHGLTGLTTQDPGHSHTVFGNTGKWGYDDLDGFHDVYHALSLVEEYGDPNGDEKSRDIYTRHHGTNLTDRVNMSTSTEAHSHAVNDSTTLDAGSVPGHKHTLSASMSDSGVEYPARAGAPLTFVVDLHVAIHREDQKTDITEGILRQLADVSPDWSNKRLGGTDGDQHIFVARGTGAIKLDYLGLTFSPGEYRIELSAPKLFDAKQQPIPNGGRLYYNLYVE